MTYDLPAIGDSITLVFRDHVHQTKVIDGLAMRDQFMVRYQDADRTLLIGDESVEWLRGYHALDSEPVRAAQAAKALSAKEEAKKPKPQKPSTKPAPLPQASQQLWPPPSPTYVEGDDAGKIREELWRRSKLGGGGRKW